MSVDVTSTKRHLTEDARDAFNPPRPSCTDFISDDLTARLQNIGARVRKNVNGGYATQRFGGLPSVTPTPFSSLVKPSSSGTLSRSSPIFRSENDTLQDVFSSSVRAADIACLPAPSPSPRKRGHAEVDEEEELEEGFLVATICAQDTVSGTPEAGVTSDDEDIMIITDMSRDPCPNRPIKPLKKTARIHRPPPSPFDCSSSTAQSCFSPSDTIPRSSDATSASSEWKDMFHQPF